MQQRINLTANFERDGYVIIDLPEAADLAPTIIASLEPAFDENHRIENAWRMSAAVRALATNETVLDALGALYGREAFPFQTLNFDRGTEQAAHSDTIHFDSTPAGFMAGVWVALEDIDENNGPLFYYPGSQALPQLTLRDMGVEPDTKENPYKLYQTHYEPGIGRVIDERGLQRASGLLKKGQALIWSANLLHGGSPIADPSRTRHSQVTHYYFKGCSYHTPLLEKNGRKFRRYPVDIRTGRNVGGVEDGRPIRVPTRQLVKSFAKRALRQGTNYDRDR